MTIGLHIQRLTSNDLALAKSAISDIHGRGPLEAGALESYLRDPANILIVAAEAGRAIGSVNGHILKRPHLNTPSAFLDELDVSPQHRRKGIAKALIVEFAQLARAAGAFEVWVLTNQSNKGAMAAYQACGFARENSDDVMLTLHLG